MSGEEEAKKRLLDLLAQASDKADRQEAIAREIQQAAQQAREVAIPSRVIIQICRPGAFLLAKWPIK